MKPPHYEWWDVLLRTVSFTSILYQYTQSYRDVNIVCVPTPLLSLFLSKAVSQVINHIKSRNPLFPCSILKTPNTYPNHTKQLFNISQDFFWGGGVQDRASLSRLGWPRIQKSPCFYLPSAEIKDIKLHYILILKFTNFFSFSAAEEWAIRVPLITTKIYFINIYINLINLYFKLLNDFLLCKI